MPNKTVKDIMVPLSQYVVVSEHDTIRVGLERMQESRASMPEDEYYHRAALVKNDANEIVGKLSYLGFLEALDPKYDNLEELESAAGSGITRKDLHREMGNLGFWEEKYPIIKERADELTMKDAMMKFDQHIEEDAALIKAMHLMVQSNALSLLTVRDDHITGIVRLSDLFEEITNIVLSKD